jgi:serine/threonine-protein kinase
MDEFLDRLHKSHLIAPGQLDSWLAALGPLGGLRPVDLAARLVSDGLLTSFQAETLLEGRYRGFLVGGQYKLLDVLARGPGRRLYVCHDLVRNRLVDLLVCHGFRGPEGSHERLKSAAQAVAGLSHDHLVPLIEVRRSGQVPILVLEHTDGTTLRELVMRAGPLDPARAASYAAQAAEALGYAHAAGFRHGSLDAHDLLVDRRGGVRVLGVGLPQSQLKPSPVAAGPLSLSGEPPSGPRADLAGLGHALAFLLTGRPAGEPLPTSVPEALRSVVERLLGDGEPFASADEAAAELHHWAPVTPPPPSAPLPGPHVLPAMAALAEPEFPSSPSFRTVLTAPPLSTPGSGASASRMAAPTPTVVAPKSAVAAPKSAVRTPKPARRKSRWGVLIAGMVVGSGLLALAGVGIVILAPGLLPFSVGTVEASRPEKPADTPQLDDGTPLVVPSIAAAFEGESVALVLVVRSAGGKDHVYLNSEVSAGDSANFAVVLDPPQRDELLAKFGGDATKALAYFKGKPVLARGSVGRDRYGKPALKVAAVDAVTVLEPVKPEDAESAVGKVAAVPFTVKSGRPTADGGRFYLNSEDDYRSEKNFSAMLTERCQQRLREQGVENILREYQGRPMIALGVVRLVKKGTRPQIDVVFPQQLSPQPPAAQGPKPEEGGS